MSPLLSIIILVFNRREALARTLQEVDAALTRLALALHSAQRRGDGSGGGGIDLARAVELLSSGVELLLGDQENEDSAERPVGQTGSGPANLQPTPGIATAAPPDDAPAPTLEASGVVELEPESLFGSGSIKFSETGDSTRTLDSDAFADLRFAPWFGMAEIIVVDNASTDGSGNMVRERFPHCQVVSLPENVGVAGFNRGADHASGTYLLILDDDAWPEGESLTHAVEFLEREQGVAGVMLQPIHPRTGALEWPFDRVSELTSDWPDLRCANLVRREAWNAVGGYEERFFLYRNDTDLALKLLGAGHDLAYNPAWRAMHDSPHIAVRRVRWFFLSTRNWCWMCRRHARGLGWIMPALMGWLWAHRLAGLSVRRHWAALRGAAAGVLGRTPSAPPCVRRDGRALRRLIDLKRALRR